MNNQPTASVPRFALHPVRIQRGHASVPAATLDRLAGIELAHGHHAAAEHLAQQAAAMREAAR